MKKIFSVFLILCLLLSTLFLTVHANAPSPNLDGSHEPQPGWLAFILVIYAIIIAFTCLVEWLVCIPFKLHYVYTKTIILTNISTQVIMHFLQWLLMAVFPGNVIDSIAWYIFTVTILEVAVVISEFLIYRKKILGYSALSRLFYVLCANTASAFGGLLLLLLIIF